MKPTMVWLTGMSGAGKITIAGALHERIKPSVAQCVDAIVEHIQGGIDEIGMDTMRGNSVCG